MTIAEQVLLSLAGDFVPYAVNVAATDVSDVVRPFMPLAEQLGRFFGCLHDGLPDGLEIECQGELAAVSTGILTLSALKGVFGGSTDEPVSYVNAPQLAEERGLEVRETSTATSRDYKSLITLRSKSHSVAGTLSSAGREQRAAHRHGRRPRGRGGAVAAHVGRAQRRPAGHDRHRGYRAGRGRHLHLVHGGRAEPHRGHGDDGDLDHRPRRPTPWSISSGGTRGSSTSTASVCRATGHLRPGVEAADDRFGAVEGALRGTVQQDGPHHGEDGGDQDAARTARVSRRRMGRAYPPGALTFGASDGRIVGIMRHAATTNLLLT